VDVLGHAGGVNLFLEVVGFALLATAEFFLNGLELFVKVILFLSAFHLALDAGIDIAVDVELFEFDFEDIGDTIEALERVGGFEEVLLFVDRSWRLAAMVSERREGSSTRAAAIMGRN